MVHVRWALLTVVTFPLDFICAIKQQIAKHVFLFPVGYQYT